MTKNMSDSDVRNRRRGVRASRARLARALTDAGLKTQAALAERIADLEGLDVPPKDVVNRVFRELPVDPQTLERVARALNCEAHKLYLTEGEMRPAVGGPGQEDADCAVATEAAAASENVAAPVESPAPAASRRATWLRWAAGVSLAVLTLAGGWVWIAQPPSTGLQDASSAGAPALNPRFGRYRIVVMPVTGDVTGELAVALRDGLKESLGVTSPAVQLLAGDTDLREIAQRLRAEAVLEGELKTVGRHTAARFFMYMPSRGHREQVWAESFARHAAAGDLPGIATRAVAAVHRALGVPAGEGRNPAHFPLAPVQDDYLQGRLFLDSAPSELNLRRAQTSFESATRQDPNYSRAFAGLCETILDYIWVGDETRNLYNAERACGRALQLTPDSPVALAAHAYFLTKTGRAREALEQYRRLVAEHAHDVDLVFGLASTEFALFRQGEAGLRDSMLRNARRAVELDPRFWKTRMWLGIFEFQSGSLDAAVPELEAAYALDANEYSVANLGTLYMCRADFTKARDLYERATTLAPQSYAGPESLGNIYYYLRDFPRSAQLRERALKLASEGGEAEIHQMWGHLADSYRRTGNSAGAIDAYVKALEIVERDFMNGNGTASDKAWRASYYTALLDLDARRVPPAVERTLERDMDEAFAAPLEPSGWLRLAQTWTLRNEPVKARAALAKAMTLCSHYQRHPDLDGLRAKSG